MELPWLSRWQPQLLALLRIVAGLLFLEHGTVKLFHFPATQGVPDPLPTLLLAAALIEVLFGLLLVVGLFTRLSAFIAAGECAVAYWMVHGPQSPFPVVNMGEPAVLFTFIFLYIAAAGPGAWSVDGARLKKEPIH